MGSCQGKYKLEHEIIEGYFLAPKTYTFIDRKTNQPIMGAAKSKVAYDWFVKQYKNPEHIRYEDIEYTFRINQVAMTISKETKTFRLATPESHT